MALWRFFISSLIRQLLLKQFIARGAFAGAAGLVRLLASAVGAGGGDILAGQILAALVDEGLQPGIGAGLLGAVVDHIQEGEAAFLFFGALQDSLGDGARHAGEGHCGDDAGQPLAHKVNRLADSQDRLALEAGMQIGGR